VAPPVRSWTAAVLRGRCACKIVTYEVSDEFVTAFNCRCSRCCAMTGSASLPWGEIEPEKLKGDELPGSSEARRSLDRATDVAVRTVGIH
jgi:hypothetical protein